MEHHADRRRLADAVQLQQAINQMAAEHEDARRQLEDANRSLQRQLAQRTGQLQTLVAELSCAEQRERHRLAQLLHDDLWQLLAGARQAADSLYGPLDKPDRDKDLQRLVEILDRSLRHLHSFSAQISPPVLYKGNMCDILKWLAGQMWKEHNFAVQVDADPLANPKAEEIRVLLFHVVRELIDNVLKHAGTSTARVTLTQEPPDFIELTVSDAGSGFDPAVKLGQGRFGTGISLSTLRHRMELLGGRMDIRSGPGEGTQVTLVAPTSLAGVRLEPISAPSVEPSTSPPAEGPALDRAGSRIRVLLADDHAVVRDGLANLLQAEPDMDVVATAANGLEAVELALQLKPEVIIMDANMPLLSGVQAARRILSQLPDAKVIALSMYSAADMDLAMRQAGAIDYLTKETAPEALVASIRRHAAAPAE